MKLAKNRNRSVTGRKITGFTLAELIVVITILAILATIGFLALSGYSQDAKDSSIKANVRSVQTAIVSEAALTNNSPRYYVAHDADYALSGAFAYVNGNSVALTGGDVGQSPLDSNYTAGKPNWVRLKLNPEKFRLSANWLPAVANAFFGQEVSASYDPTSLMAAGADFSVVESNGKKRVNSYVQVWGFSPATKAASVSGNFPTSNVPAGNVSGLIRAVPGSATNLTGALVDGSAGVASSPADIVWDDSAGRKWKDATVAATCNAYRVPANGMQYVGSVGDGVYWIDPDGGSSANAFKVFCDMTTDGGGWTMVYKKSAGVSSANPSTDYFGGNLNESNAALLNKGQSASDYANRIITNHWSSFSSARVEVLKAGAVQKFFKYSTVGTNNADWFSKAKLADSSYTDLAGTQNYWSIAWDATNKRYFFVSSLYNGCALDVGWLVVVDNVAGGCSWEPVNSIRYSTVSTAQNWTTGSVDYADSLVILLK